MSEDDETTPEGLDDFFKKVFGGEKNAEEFAADIEDPMVEAWKGIYEIYRGMLAGGFTQGQANGVMGAYIYNLISGIEGQ